MKKRKEDKYNRDGANVKVGGKSVNKAKNKIEGGSYGKEKSFREF